MNTNTEDTRDKKLHPRLTQDTIERENNAYSRGAITSTFIILAIAAMIGYFYYQSNYVPTTDVAPMGQTMMANPTDTNTARSYDSNTNTTPSYDSNSSNSTITTTTPDRSTRSTTTTP